MWTKLALAVSLVANLVAGLYIADLRGPRVLARIRAEVNADATCKTKIAARDRQWLLYVANRPAVEVNVAPPAPVIYSTPDVIVQPQTNWEQEEFYRNLNQE